MIAQSFEYFQYEVTPIPAQPGRFLVSPAWGYPLQWGESYEDQWEQSLEDCLHFLDVTEAQLLAL